MWYQNLALVFCLFAAIPTCFAAENTQKCLKKRMFLIEGESISLCWSPSIEGWESPECFNHNGKVCGAQQLIVLAKQQKIKLSRELLSGGKNPGSVFCSQLSAEVMIAKLENKSEMTFCRTKDKTFVDCNAIANAYYSQ